MATATATALALLLAVVIGRLNPALAIWIAPGSVARTGLGAVLVGVAGAVLPIRRVLRVDPATSFRMPHDHPAHPVPTSRDPVLHVTGLTKTFGQGELAVTAVGGVDLEVHPGEVVLIMGPSGSGKTTLLLMLGAMLRPTAGIIQVGGLDIAGASEHRLPALRARRFGFVFQDFNLLSALTVAENVELACNLAGVTGHPAHQRARVLL